MNRLLSWFAPKAALRQTKDGETPPVTNMELFFDLVYVFTIIQLSHYLLAHQTLAGVAQVATLFLAVWWAWNYTSWATNWINPHHTSGRLLMVCLMGCALTMAVAIPTAYTETAALFVGAYIAMGLIRGIYMALVFRGETMGKNYAQLTAWSGIAGLFWIAGAVYAEFRLFFWVIAVFVDYMSPLIGFWLPKIGSTPMSSWPLSGLHLVERNQLIFIIALGESILLLGGTLLDTNLNFHSTLAAIVGFLIIVSVWWLYFIETAEKGERIFSHIENHAEVGRSGLTYAHGVMVGGAIIIAVAVEKIIAHPDTAVHLPSILITIFGPIIYLLGSLMFYKSISAGIPTNFIISIGALLVVGFIAHLLHFSGLILGALVLFIIIVLVITTHNHDFDTS
ncbi:low temperature requirement protein A [Fodinibius salsisoli]|uniref:Low temperature requirement protein A n=1 Tax=Fodinibius salsisoli TaxID=2820877 RepID=A0ABT3PPD9_9BACT|nr:low temperature requirement protein A [Fodinibius salsisoli]MCW9707723.1 low temperature requirement protein A [Fodinibius salsisoli]